MGGGSGCGWLRIPTDRKFSCQENLMPSNSRPLQLREVIGRARRHHVHEFERMPDNYRRITPWDVVVGILKEEIPGHLLSWPSDGDAYGKQSTNRLRPYLRKLRLPRIGDPSIMVSWHPTSIPGTILILKRFFPESVKCAPPSLTISALNLLSLLIKRHTALPS